MSAFVMGKEAFAAIMSARHFKSHYNDVAAYRYNDEGVYIEGNNVQVVGQKLVDQNLRSVNERYGDSEEPFIYDDTTTRDYTPVEVIRLIHSYRYQSCETDDWESTEAHAIIKALLHRAEKALPGYDAAPWDL